jgi:pimeloyl-ACP methyl ester carboxylesterase
MNAMQELVLEYKIIGDGKNTLVIETGIGGSFYDWYPIVQKIKEDFTIIIYHRAGYGKSETSITPRTTRNIAQELNSLLERIGLKDKFILIGHSFGGLCVQQYAKMYPNKLKGIMLVDSTSFNFKQLYMLNTPVMSSFIEIDKMVVSNMNSSKKSKEELREQNQNMISTYEKFISPSEMNDVEEFFTNPTLYKTIAEEFKNWERDGEDIKSIAEFPNIPLVAIARDNKVAEAYWVKYKIPQQEALIYETEWHNLQIELSKLSDKGKLIIAENSDHEVYLDRPDVIIQCLKTLLCENDK